MTLGNIDTVARRHAATPRNTEVVFRTKKGKEYAINSAELSLAPGGRKRIITLSDAAPKPLEDYERAGAEWRWK